MKEFLILALVALSFGTKTEHSFTMGIYETNDFSDSDIEDWTGFNLNYRGEGTVDIFLTYTTEYLKDYTMWSDDTAEGTFESEWDSWFDDETDQVYL